MKKMVRVYRAFLQGILIGLFFAIILSPNISAVLPEQLQILNQEVVVLVFSGILGGVLYTIMVDGHVELPRFTSQQGDSFEAGLFGDLMLGIAGAFVFDFLISSLLFPYTVGPTAPVTTLKVTAAKGIIGGYGGRAILDLALQKFLKRIDRLELEKDQALKQNEALQHEVEEIEAEKEKLVHGTDLISQLNEQVTVGLPAQNLQVLLDSIEAAPIETQSQIFNLTMEFRSLSSRSQAMRTRTQRTVPIFKALVKRAPQQHQYHAQLAFALKDAAVPQLAEALSHIDQAIHLRGLLDKSAHWKYELNRAILRIQNILETTGNLVSTPGQRDQIIRDLLTVSETHSLADILKEAKANHLTNPISNWLIENSLWDTPRNGESELVRQLQQALQSVTANALDGLVPDSSNSRPLTPLTPEGDPFSPAQLETVIESIKQVLANQVCQAMPLRELPFEVVDALEIGLSALGVLKQKDNFDALEAAWQQFVGPRLERATDTSTDANVIDPSSTELLMADLDRLLGGPSTALHQPIPPWSPDTTHRTSERIHSDSTQIVSVTPRLEPPTGGFDPSLEQRYPNFPRNFTFLGRCYDILGLDPLNTGDSAKVQMAFYFSPDEGERIPGTDHQFKPRGTNYAPAASGGLSVNSRTQILQTASDTQALFANTLGGGILALIGQFLPFSHSFSYQKFKRARTEERSIYTVTKADYLVYSLALKQHNPQELHLDSQFRQAVKQLPSTDQPESYQAFITRFGTHVATHVKFGGLAYRCIRLSESLYTELLQRGVDLQVEAGKLFEAGFSRKEQGLTYREIRDSSEEFRFNGGVPSADWYSWFASIADQPAPVKMDLKPLDELLTNDFFPSDSYIQQKRQLLQASIQSYLAQNADKPIWEPWRSVSLGGHGGSSFSDIDIGLHNLDSNKAQYELARVVEVRVWGGKCIDRVQLILNTGAFEPHGGPGGSMQSLQLADGESIAAIKVTEGSPKFLFVSTIPHCITSIEIITNQQRRLIVGTPLGPVIDLDIPEHYQVIGFHGHAGQFVDQLGVIASPLPHLFSQPPTAPEQPISTQPAPSPTPTVLPFPAPPSPTPQPAEVIPVQAIQLIKQREGFRAQAYKDAGHGWAVATIGYGTTRYPNGRSVKQGDTVTQAQAEGYLIHALEYEFKPALEKIPNWSRMNLNQRSALYSFAYNLGKGFYGDLEHFNSMTNLCDTPSQWTDIAAVKRVFGLYVKSNGQVFEGLVSRRQAEAELFCTPVHQGSSPSSPHTGGQPASRQPTQRFVNDPNPPLSVRSGPGSHHEKLNALPQETPLTIVHEQDGWLQISEPTPGWVAKKLTSEHLERIIRDPAPPSNIRSGPGGNHPIVQTMENGTTIQVIEERNGWLHLIAPTDGWIFKELTVTAGSLSNPDLSPWENGREIGKTTNLSIPYFSQRDNATRPYQTCNMTCAAMIVEYFYPGTNQRTAGQLEDEMTRWCVNTTGRKASIYEHTWIVKTLAHWKVKSLFNMKTPFRRIKSHLYSGKPVIYSGKFTGSGHIIVLRGYDETGFWVNDPFGEWFASGYQNKSGENLHYSYSMIERLSYSGRYAGWAHLCDTF